MLMGGVSIGTLVNGLILGNDYVLIALAITLLYKHSKYIPLWLPAIGTLAAYSAYAAERFFALSGLLNIGIASIFICGVGLGFHKWLLDSIVEDEDTYSGLLLSLGLVIVLTNAIAFFTSSYSITYNKTLVDWSIYVPPPVDNTLYAYDIVSLCLAVIFIVGIWFFLSSTMLGKRMRAVMSNRALARDLGVSVKNVDIYLIIIVCLLGGLSGIIRGMKYDLKPEMMFAPGLKALAITITCGPGNIVSAFFGSYGLGIIEEITKEKASLSPFSDAVSYIIMLAVLLVRSMRRSGKWHFILKY